MMILNNEEISTLLSMDNCLRHLEAGYKKFKSSNQEHPPTPLINEL
jgi:hypothetical protein